MLCAISQAVPEDPVVSLKSGHVFERSLIEKYLAEHNKCPITEQELSKDDLMSLKAGDPVKPRHSPAMGIPGMLVMFHKEWDALMLECFDLRKELGDARRQLAASLYQHDAACRVIARLLREKEHAQQSLENMTAKVMEAQRAAEAQRRPAAEDEPDNKRAKRDMGVPEAVAQAIEAKSQALFEARSKRDANPAGHADRAALQQLAPALAQPLHSTTQPGVLCMALAPTDPVRLVATGGADHTVQVLDLTEERVVASLNAHSKKVTAIAFTSPDTFVSGSADKTVKLWRAKDESYSASLLTSFDSAVVSTAVHPVSKLVVAAAANGTSSLVDVEAEEVYWKFSESEQGDAGVYHCAAMHPDGRFFAAGTGVAKLRIFDVRKASLITEVSQGIEGGVRSICFNENGYWVALACDAGVQVVDLRKQKLVLSFKPFEDDPCNCLAWDGTGKYLACGGPVAKIYEIGGKKTKTAEIVKSLLDLPKKVNTLAFGPLAHSLYVGAADHNLRTFTC